MGKAKTRAAKLKAKRGRRLLQATEREPNGRKSRRINSLSEMTAAQERAVRAPVASARARHLNITEEQALDPRRGYTLGNLLLDGKITQRQHDAGVKIGETFARYYGINGYKFPSARAQDLFAIRSGPGEESPENAKRAASSATNVMAIRKVLMNVSDINTGRRVLSACMSACVEDIEQARTWPEHMLTLLRKGLNKAGDHFGMAG